MEVVNAPLGGRSLEGVPCHTEAPMLNSGDGHGYIDVRFSCMVAESSLILLLFTA